MKPERVDELLKRCAEQQAPEQLFDGTTRHRLQAHLRELADCERGEPIKSTGTVDAKRDAKD